MNRRVLLVDDEPAVLDSLHRQLCFDFDLYIAESGAEALKLMETSQKFAVVLTDMRMSVILSESSAKREQVSIHSLPEDAILAEDIHSVDGMLLLSQGQQLVEPLRQP